MDIRLTISTDGWIYQQINWCNLRVASSSAFRLVVTRCNLTLETTSFLRPKCRRSQLYLYTRITCLTSVLFIYLFSWLRATPSPAMEQRARDGWDISANHYQVITLLSDGKRNPFQREFSRQNSTLPAFKFTKYSLRWKIIRQHCVIFLALFPVKRRTLKILNEQFFIGRPRKTVPWLLLLLQDIFSYKRKDLGKHKLNTLCVCYVVLFEWQPISWGAVSLMPCALLGAKQTASFTGRERPLTWTKCSSIIDMRYIFL